MAEPERRRRRLRFPARTADDVPGPPAAPEQTEPAEPAAPRTTQPAGGGTARPSRFRPPGNAGDDPERGLRGLVGSGSSQVTVTAALRARDASQPSAEQLADAEENLPIVRRNWTPREELPHR